MHIIDDYIFFIGCNMLIKIFFNFNFECFVFLLCVVIFVGSRTWHLIIITALLFFRLPYFCIQKRMIRWKSIITTSHQQQQQFYFWYNFWSDPRQIVGCCVFLSSVNPIDSPAELWFWKYAVYGWCFWYQIFHSMDFSRWFRGESTSGSTEWNRILFVPNMNLI